METFYDSSEMEENNLKYMRKTDYPDLLDVNFYSNIFIHAKEQFIQNRREKPCRFLVLQIN